MSHLPRTDQEEKYSLGKEDEVEVGLRSARGEPIRYMLASPDGKLFFSGTVVPYPIESKDGNCRLEARLGLPEAQTVLVYGEGLTPNTKIPMVSVSEEEKQAPVLAADGQGRAVAIIGPYVAGKDSGTVRLSVAIKGCTVSVEVPWGKGSYHPL